MHKEINCRIVKCIHLIFASEFAYVNISQKTACTGRHIAKGEQPRHYNRGAYDSGHQKGSPVGVGGTPLDGLYGDVPRAGRYGLFVPNRVYNCICLSYTECLFRHLS